MTISSPESACRVSGIYALSFPFGCSPTGVVFGPRSPRIRASVLEEECDTDGIRALS